MLCYVKFNVWQRVPRQKKEAGSYGDVVIQKKVKTVIDKENYERRGSEEGQKRTNANEEHKEETAWISGTHHEKGEVRKSYYDRKNKRGKKQSATAKCFYRKPKQLGEKACANEEIDADD